MSLYNDRWRLNLIGRNLTKEYTIANSSTRALSGLGSRTGSTIPGGHGDAYATVSRGREIILVLSYKYN
ncbi:MAG: hypothetical protein H7144_18700 [Burkholderiales bacterium]|nr:hypothetical protein [Phycisphaerae bacterium]